MKKINHRSSWVIVLWHNHDHSPIIRSVLEEADFVDITPIFWVKPGTVRYGGDNSFARAVETGTYARIGEKKEITYNIDPDEPTRPNYSIIKAVTTRWLYEGENKNPAEKPVELASYWLSRFGTVGSTVLVVCAGTGSEVMAAIGLKRNVVAVEKDPAQWKAIQERIAAHVLKASGKASKGGEESGEKSTDVKPDVPDISQSQEAPLPKCAICKETATAETLDLCDVCSASVHVVSSTPAPPCKFSCAACVSLTFCSEACHTRKGCVGAEATPAPPAEATPSATQQVTLPLIDDVFHVFIVFFFSDFPSSGRLILLRTL